MAARTAIVSRTAGTSSAEGTPMTTAAGLRSATTAAQPSGGRSPPTYTTSRPARRSAVANASTPSSWREPRASPTTTVGPSGCRSALSKAAAIRRWTVALTRCSPATLMLPSRQPAPTRCSAGISQPSTTSSKLPSAKPASSAASRPATSKLEATRARASTSPRSGTDDGRSASLPDGSSASTRSAAWRGDQPESTSVCMASRRRRAASS